MIELGIRYDDIVLEEFGDRNPYTAKIVSNLVKQLKKRKELCCKNIYSLGTLGIEEFKKKLEVELKGYREELLKAILGENTKVAKNPEWSAKGLEKKFNTIFSQNLKTATTDIVKAFFTTKGEPRSVAKSTIETDVESALGKLYKGVPNLLTMKNEISKFTATGVVLRLLGYESPMKTLLDKNYPDPLPRKIFSSLKFTNVEESRVGASPSLKEAIREGKERFSLKTFKSFYSPSPYTGSGGRDDRYSRTGQAEVMYKPADYSKAKCNYFGLFLETPEVITENLENLLKGKAVKEFPNISYSALGNSKNVFELEKITVKKDQKISDEKLAKIERRNKLEAKMKAIYEEFGAEIDPLGLIDLTTSSWAYAYLFYSLNNPGKRLVYGKNSDKDALFDQDGEKVSFGGITANYKNGKSRGLVQFKELSKVISATKLDMPQLGGPKDIFLASGCLIINFKGDKELLEEIKNSPVSDLNVLKKGTAYLEYAEEV